MPSNPHRPARLLGATAAAAVAVSLLGPAPAAGAATPGPCAGLQRVVVPGAEKQVSACLDDLTTAGTVASGHSVAADFAGLTPAGATNPTGVPGGQIDGYFPDTSTSNANNGWNHDSQFVIRLPERWNGGLVVAGTPGVRRQYANDFAISDWVLAQGYAYAATDKGNTGAAFYQDGAEPGDAIAEWNRRVTQLTRAAKAVTAQRYGRAPRRTYAAGISNGGYLVRWQLENHPELYSGGVDWEGTLWRAEGPNLLTSLPATLRAYPRYAATGDPAAKEAIIAAGFPAASEPLWDYHYKVYWDLTQRIYREELDPGYDGATEAGTPFCASGTPGCDADYDYASRPRAVREAVRKIALTGRIGKPMITLHGTLDTLLPIGQDSDVYERLIRGQGRDRLHRYYRLEGGTHVDGLYDAHPGLLRPILPCFRSAFTALESWTTGGHAPPADRTLPRPASGDLVGTCSLTS
ncbi:tannase/feruloyl esterase family alpha/beta hydrolase [Sphaerisporangium sp. TRM90804]|uniref:tannase/feruloyl esterase family alpha/beta hydrolase n=1 Tax=Sphaerisporangium sp. TRM90804 TaxID=3031113 RepID=UPI002447D877|nr:tannase/feruloyl esterase family alpha/beta hydrolase [Sphaerisporangium sp. TRM90804]MDH2426312.1 tannase/feruloyl esterase family alpha/beta hydrolase [Sphaerisporangium sp. TRM90804]